MLIPEEPLYRVENDALFFRLVKAAFAQRRKTFLNNMKNAHWKDCDAGRIENLLGIWEPVRKSGRKSCQFNNLRHCAIPFHIREKRKNILDSQRSVW
jgi:16S rRNA A1518/A1519 N6-dimethyltransferase RsmA/KsgA/DIM1 with predicted DNA glycosylase/AP lyase activity